MRFAISTLGCKINQYESQLLREGLISAGHTEHPFSEPGADWYIINTCTVTHRSDADARKLIRRALRHGGRVVATGCQAVMYAEEIKSISNEVIVALPDKVYDIFNIDKPLFISDFEGHSRAFVKVQQGCDMFCAYCIVPHTKGSPVSRRWEDIVSEIESLQQRGYKEVVLTGINIGLYEGGLARLLEKVITKTSVERIRISSLEPWTLEESLMGMVVQEPRMCKHLHLPLQHGSDTLLKAMGRPYTSGYFQSLVERIQSVSNEIAIGSDIIVGFPGEDDEAFEESFRFIADTQIAYLHVFPFSPRPGTPAYLMGSRVNEKVVKERARRLRELSREKRQAFARSRIGSEEEILVTKECHGSSFGVTSNYLTVQLKSPATEGDFVRVRLMGMEGSILQGEYLG
jgi:threonylcarbamoyladenosine tRNA methylthiotransferase MtaB